MGLSPRVRGNLNLKRQRPRHKRSIPACAGEPRDDGQSGQLDRVYPRVCGGTRPYPACRPLLAGLSPRVRGNLTIIRSGLTWDRSIPACAGEPARDWQDGFNAGVYPRVCGGTSHPRPGLDDHRGLSPRVRGNLGAGGCGGGMPGSIPACAGEPSCAALGTVWQWVYPRVCGGTANCVWGNAAIRGLSPRVRGNPITIGLSSPATRSIPACAGEPSRK